MFGNHRVVVLNPDLQCVQKQFFFVGVYQCLSQNECLKMKLELNRNEHLFRYQASDIQHLVHIDLWKVLPFFAPERLA